ncbi:MAG TPA: barstar family protein [Burkholderiaceae bacterium]|nr:barstar family protein [Burkholderiaceae bacterium]
MNDSNDKRCEALPVQTIRPLRGIEREQLRDWAARRGHRWVEVELAGSVAKAGVLERIARAFEFPAWFGMNLDALYDSLTDLPTPESGGYVILLDRLTQARDFDTRQRTALLGVFRDAADSFAAQSIPFRVLYS